MLRHLQTKVISAERVMNYYAKEEAERIQQTLSHFIGKKCYYNQSKNKAILEDILISRSLDIIDVNGAICNGYSVVLRFNNAVVLPANLFSSYNNFSLAIEPRLALNSRKNI